MEGRNIEPRTTMWAVAEVWWEDQTGKPNRASATLEDTSLSGACIRLKTPITVGSKLTVKWHREHFSAVARNCRRDGREFLLGVRREALRTPIETSPPSTTSAPSVAAPGQAELASSAPKNLASQPSVPDQSALSRPAQQSKSSAPNSTPGPVATVSAVSAPATTNPEPRNHGKHYPAPGRDRAPLARTAENHSPISPTLHPAPVSRAPSQTEGSSPRQERKVMEPKRLFPKFWHRQPDGTDAPDKSIPREAPVNHSNASPPQA
jgi:hypothetical protein